MCLFSKLLVSQFVQGYESRTVTVVNLKHMQLLKVRLLTKCLSRLNTLNVHTSKLYFIFYFLWLLILQVNCIQHVNQGSLDYKIFSEAHISGTLRDGWKK